MTTEQSFLEPGQNTLLDLKLDELKRELSDVHAPDMEAVLRARFRKTKPAAPARPRLWWMPPLALAATIAMRSTGWRFSTRDRARRRPT